LRDCSQEPNRITIEAIGFAQYQTGEIVVAENETHIINSSLQIAPIQADVEIIAPAADSQGFTGGAVGVIVLEEAAEPLIKAALNDDLEALAAVLTRSNVNVRDANLGTTALEYAVHNGNREMVQVLLAAGADVNSRNSSRESVLMRLSEESTADIVWDLINAGAKVDLKDDEGETALFEAATEKNVAVLTALLHAGAKVDVRNNQGQTALMMAASNDRINNLRALIRAGADMNARDNEGKTALDYAIDDDHRKSIKLLQSYGAITGDKPKPVAAESQ
jgi:ankyrin repeat protein